MWLHMTVVKANEPEIPASENDQSTRSAAI
jgi:hypothetical protein